MQVSVELADSSSFHLSDAVLVYRAGNRAYATVHSVERVNGAPFLAPGRTVEESFLRALARGLGESLPAEIFPENVLARTSNMIVWWTPAGRQLMFLSENVPEYKILNGKCFPHPALVFKLQNRCLYVRALEKSTRPSAATQLMVAPYWNVNEKGEVCMGSMRVPRDRSLSQLPKWEKSFWQSAFSHANSPRLTSHPAGFVGLWSELVDSADDFPAKYLLPAQQTLSQFIED